MKNISTFIFAIITTALHAAPTIAQNTLNIGYFAEWPLPAHYGRISGAYDEVLDAPTEWTAFDNSIEMLSSLNDGEIQIALSLGIVPLLEGTSAGMNVSAVDIAVSYPNNENCVAATELRYSFKYPKVIQGSAVALAKGTISHFNFIQLMKHFEIDASTVEIVDMTPSQAATALSQNKVDIACGWGNALSAMLKTGTPLISSDEKMAAGMMNFDVIAVENSFAADNAETIANFLKITSELNESFSAAPSRMYQKIATSIDMTVSGVQSSMSGFEFPSISTKLDQEWMSGGVQVYLKNVADFFVDQGVTFNSLQNYDFVVDKRYLKAAANIPLIAE